MDPHIWLSPANYKAMATATLNELVALNPKGKSSYEKNYKSLVASIDSIDALAKSKLANLKIKKFIIYHPALSYFASDYGLEQISIEKDGKVITTRTHVTGDVGNVFKAAGIALPANIAEQPAS